MNLAALFAHFKQGQIYVRRKIHEKAGGQEQGGISTPRSIPAILLFRKEQAVGYEQDDGWHIDGFYHFTGEGQSFDMQMTRGNKAIRDHPKTGKVLMLFESVKSESGLYRFEGFMNCVDYYEKDTDALGNKRRVFVFRLTPVEVHPICEILKQTEVATTFLDLRADVLALVEPLNGEAAYVTGNSEELLKDEKSGLCEDLHVQIPLVNGNDYRQRDIRKFPEYGSNRRNEYQRRVEFLLHYVFERANGFCEGCGYPAPFICKNGNPYLEVHYVSCLGDYGLSRPDGLIALCPTCHSKAHYGSTGEGMAVYLDATAANIENALDCHILKLVTAAIIRDDEGRILAAQRARGEFAGCWEFPGGQVKKGETLKQCLVREISEELNLEIQGLTPFLKVDYDYETFYMRLYSFTCKAKGVVALHDHSRITWVAPKDLVSLDWVPADEGS